MNYENDKGFSAKAVKSSIAQQTDQVLDDAKKLGNKIYDEGKNTLNDLQCNIKDHSDKIAQNIHEKPVYSVLVAAGVGLILGHLLRR